MSGKTTMVALAAALLVGAAASVSGQTPARPIPGPVVPPPWYRAAVAKGTRTADGRPGPKYWTNHASYDVRAELDPATARVVGSETIVYKNNSPDSLFTLVLDLYMNIHKAGEVRNEQEEITGGVVLKSLAVDGVPIEEGPANLAGRWSVAATVLRVRPARALPPGGSATLTVAWEEVFPQSNSGRAGWSEREVYFVGYWYPRMAVYDDLRGWDAEAYLGGAEFYDGFGDYRVSLTVPAGWTVMGTGTLDNPEQVLTPQTRQRLAAAATADSTVHVATREDRGAGRVTLPGTGGKLTYAFSAENVRDFAWTTSNTQLWDATSATVPGKRVLVHSFWREARAPGWSEQARFGKHAIEHHSRYTGFTYPWPHMTIVEGDDIIGGGMEYPMLTLIGTYQGSPPKTLYSTTTHEIGHMWIPMIVGANEKRWAWIDEGTTDFLEDHARPDLFPGDAGVDENDRRPYLTVARREQEQPLMTHGDYYEPGPSYTVASYYKPATVLAALRALIGTEAFDRGYRAFIAEWAYKHPTPWDMWATFERAAGQDLDWFWQTWYYETWTLDQAVGGVAMKNGAPVVTIEDKGFAFMPARVRITTTRAGTIDRTVPVETWLSGATRAEIELPATVGQVTRVQVDPEGFFPDLNPVNNVWTAPAP